MAKNKTYLPLAPENELAQARGLSATDSSHACHVCRLHPKKDLARTCGLTATRSSHRCHLCLLLPKKRLLKRAA